MGIGARLKELRVRKGETLQQVADAVKASKPHIWELEAEKSGKPLDDQCQTSPQMQSAVKPANVPFKTVSNSTPSLYTRKRLGQWPGLTFTALAGLTFTALALHSQPQLALPSHPWPFPHSPGLIHVPSQP